MMMVMVMVVMVMMMMVGWLVGRLSGVGRGAKSPILYITTPDQPPHGGVTGSSTDTDDDADDADDTIYIYILENHRANARKRNPSCIAQP